MHRGLFLLILMGQCSLFLCRHYEYYFIEEPKTWDEAQRYCREGYKDLATVPNMKYMETLYTDSTENQANAWIGLYSISGKENRRWHWSLPGVEFNAEEMKWRAGEPNDAGGHLENCAVIDSSSQLMDFGCSNDFTFICYNEQNTSLNFIDNKKKWREAQSYCREHHTDLASGAEQLNEAVSKFKSSDEPLLWIGLFRDTWRWSDGSNYSYRHWRDVEKFILINESKNWDEAVKYCREHHRDLVSITSLEQQELVQEKAKNANTSHIWLGLRYSCALDLWFWVNDQLVCYKNWANETDTGDCNLAVAMETGGEHKWFKKNDTEMFNFICSLS
ncbi:macrophage mannose receptor 1-like [Oreochromis aureus]|uniref:macrophage mannose receptor 1-like n=1 Tax=Oreochromis aureus TaxID=47969 RepID=UPI001952AEE1|nr:macrophage mannose receptor 1-like [Oreochromis aureus]